MKEKNSSLCDNEIKKEDIDTLISAKIKNPGMRSQWFYYQTIRDAMRGDYVGSPGLSKKIMQAIDQEPTQIGRYSQTKELAIEVNSYYWQFALAFTVLFAIGLAAVNFPQGKTEAPVQLVYEDMPTEIINAHYANTSSTANYFVQTSLLVK